MPVTPSFPVFDILLLPVGLNPTTPQKEAGILADPAASEHTPKAEHFVATLTASPPEDPPLINSFLYGFKESP